MHDAHDPRRRHATADPVPGLVAHGGVHPLPATTPPAKRSESRYRFGYRIRLDVPASLGCDVRITGRSWTIIDAEANRRDVTGRGVVGREPDIGPGDHFTYESSVELPTPWGTMEGWLECEVAGRVIRVPVARFVLGSDPRSEVCPRDGESTAARGTTTFG